MYTKLLISFVIGSSCIVVLRHWIGFYRYLKQNQAYETSSETFKFTVFSFYVILSTFYFGLLNMLITYLRIRYQFNIHKIYLVFSIISPLLIISHNLYFKLLWDTYTFNTFKDKFIYSMNNFIAHFVIFNFIMKGLEIYLNEI